MKDFWNFKKMITPIIIPILFWIGTIVCIIAGIVFMVLGATGYSNSDSGEMVLLGIGYLVFGPIVVRIYCELLIILFSINDTLTDIKKQLNREQDQDDQTRL
jgi:uncharacterized membrane protein